MGFVGNCAPCGLSPQTDGMPVIHKKNTSSDVLSISNLFYSLTFTTVTPHTFAVEPAAG